MNFKHFFKIYLLLFLVILSFSCGKGGGASDVFIPDLSAQWKNTSTTDADFYNFDPAATGVASSTFTGVENYFATGSQFFFAGSFQNSKIEFTFNSGSKNGTKYTGVISGSGIDEIITLTTPTGTIILKRP